ncbi:response regulator [Longimicrobium sp.]|uniref:response regulator n=1 Tax=Longimicrobium sp. TaxID=2029185 RepID=UPI002C29CF9D|nr:response regulator [Longimicrobium sp.]HSU13583.1 response regulator [Longimicrobium sp.]
MSTKILLVEDNEDNQEIYRCILAHYGYDVLQAFDGGHGVEMARAHGPDLILMDLTMPVVDGLQATRMLKADPATAAIPIVALTAHTQREDFAAAEAAGCDAYLTKPVEPQRVAAEVRRILALSRDEGAAGPARRDETTIPHERPSRETDG